MVTLNTPISTNSAYSAAVLLGRAAQMRASQQAAIMGAKIRAARPRWWVKTRSKRGAVIIAATMPESRSAAPCKKQNICEYKQIKQKCVERKTMNPAVSSEYPYGSRISFERRANVFVLTVNS